MIFLRLTTWFPCNRRPGYTGAGQRSSCGVAVSGRCACGHSRSTKLFPLASYVYCLPGVSHDYHVKFLQVSIILYNVVALISSVFHSFFRNSAAAGVFCLCGEFPHSGRGCLPCRCESSPVNLPGRYNFPVPVDF